MDRRDIEVSIAGTTCRAWHFAPAARAAAPCVVMGHGFGATRDGGLERYAQRFVEEGLHALVFDYRHFGASDGEPRQLLSIKRQLADWSAMLATARTLPGVDPARVVAWGTSFGGGHALVAGVRDGGVAAIVAQCPMMDGRAAFRRALSSTGVGNVIRMIGHGIRDLVGALLGAKAHCLPVAAPPGRLGFMTTPDALPGYEAIFPHGFRNEVTARTSLSIASYRPVTLARRLHCPLLLLVCDNDDVAPARAAVVVAEIGAERVEMHRFPIGHFDIYQGADFARALEVMVAFLRRHLVA